MSLWRIFLGWTHRGKSTIRLQTKFEQSNGKVSARAVRWLERGRRAPLHSAAVPSTEEIAQRVGVTPQTVRDWQKKGLLPEPVKAHRGRRGTAFRWPDGSEDQAAWVYAKLEAGLTVMEIREALARGEYTPRG